MRVALTAYQSISVIWSITNKIFHQLKVKKVPLCKPLLTPESDQQLISPNSIPPEHCHCRHLKFSFFFFFFKGQFSSWMLLHYTWFWIFMKFHILIFVNCINCNLELWVVIINHIFPLNQTTRSHELREWSQIQEALALLSKFFFSVPNEIYREQYQEYRYWC